MHNFENQFIKIKNKNKNKNKNDKLLNKHKRTTFRVHSLGKNVKIVPELVLHFCFYLILKKKYGSNDKRIKLTNNPHSQDSRTFGLVVTWIYCFGGYVAGVIYRGCSMAPRVGPGWCMERMTVFGYSMERRVLVSAY